MRIVIGSCIRNQALSLPNFLSDMEAVEGEEVAFVFFENDSTDQTRDLLLEWAAARPRVSLITRRHVQGLRTERLAQCRNAIWKRVLDLDAHTFVAIDSDYPSRLDVVRLKQSIRDCPAHACFANSLPYHYDAWALRSHAFADSDVWREGTWRYFSRWPLTLHPSNRLLPVRSAFNGIGIYRVQRLGPARSCRYAGRYADEYPLCEHVNFHACIAHAVENASFVVDPRLIYRMDVSIWTVVGVHWVLVSAFICSITALMIGGLCARCRAQKCEPNHHLDKQHLLSTEE